MKRCSRCHKDLPEDHFRLRYDKRGKGSRTLTYPNNTCKQCDVEISNRHYFKNKDNPDFHKNWLKKSNDYYKIHREEIKAKMKLKRQTPEYKEMMRKYRLKNKNKIYTQEVVTKKRYSAKHRDAITDEYVIRQLVTQGVSTREILEKPENYQLIEAKRLQLLIKRKIKNHGNKH